MPNQHIKKLNSAGKSTPERHYYDFSVMKPFVKFAINAILIIGKVLIGIVKTIPKPLHNTPEKKDRVIRI